MNLAALALSVVLLTAGTAALGQDDAARVRAGDGGVPAVRIAAVERLTRAAVDELRATFPGTPAHQFTVFVHSGESTLPERARRGLHAGTPGMALLGRHEIYIVLDEVARSEPGDLRTVVMHEVVHELLDQYAGAAARWVPRWFHEGLAQVLSGNTYLGSREEDLIYPAATDRLLRWTDLRTDFPEDPALRRQAYAQAFSFVGFLIRSVGWRPVVQAARDCSEQDWYRGSFARETGHPLGDEIERWERYLRHESGAGWRFLFNNCFSYLMIAAFVLLALAGIRRWTRDARLRDKLEREDRMADHEELGE